MTFPLEVKTETPLFHRFLDSGQSFVPAVPAPSKITGQRVGSSPYTLLPVYEIGNTVIESFTYQPEKGRYPFQISGEADRDITGFFPHIKLLYVLTGYGEFAISMTC